MFIYLWFQLGYPMHFAKIIWKTTITGINGVTKGNDELFPSTSIFLNIINNIDYEIRRSDNGIIIQKSTLTGLITTWTNLLKSFSLYGRSS